MEIGFLISTIARVRRAMPRNADAMALCGELERLLTKPTKPKFDRAGYMREYMRKRRAKGQT